MRERVASTKTGAKFMRFSGQRKMNWWAWGANEQQALERLEKARQNAQRYVNGAKTKEERQKFQKQLTELESRTLFLKETLTERFTPKKTEIIKKQVPKKRQQSLQQQKREGISTRSIGPASLGIPELISLIKWRYKGGKSYKQAKEFDKAYKEWLSKQKK